MQAKDIMSTKIVGIKRDALVKDAIDLLINHSISGLAVFDENENIVGIVSEKDILIAYDFLNDIHEPIDDFINTDIISVSPETDVEEISKTLVQRNIKRVPVLSDGQLIGIVSRHDILKAIKQMNEGEK